MEHDTTASPKSKSIKSSKGKQRRGHKRKYNKNNSNNSNHENFTVIGQNAASLVSKKESLMLSINCLKPSVIVIQESKLKKVGMIKLPGYQIFEKLRTNNNGGGLFTAIDCSLDPVSVDVESTVDMCNC